MSSRERDAGPRRRVVQRIEGQSFWQMESPLEPNPVELSSRDELELDRSQASWTVHGLVGEPYSVPVDSTSPVVRGFLGRLVAAKQAIARRHAAVTPNFKPERRSPHSPAESPFVDCPLCRPQEAGEALPDCELCDGWGIVSVDEANAWHGGHD